MGKSPVHGDLFSRLLCRSTGKLTYQQYLRTDSRREKLVYSTCLCIKLNDADQVLAICKIKNKTFYTRFRITVFILYSLVTQWAKYEHGNNNMQQYEVHKIQTYLFNTYNCYFMFFLSYFPGFGDLIVHFSSTEHQLLDSLRFLRGYSSFRDNPLELGVSNHFIKWWPSLWETENGLGAHINQLKKSKYLCTCIHLWTNQALLAYKMKKWPVSNFFWKLTVTELIITK